MVLGVLHTLKFSLLANTYCAEKKKWEMDCAFSEGSVTTLKNSSQNILNYFLYPGP